MQCGVAMLSDALSWFTKVRLEAGYVVVLETAGRSGHWNPGSVLDVEMTILDKQSKGVPIDE